MVFEKTIVKTITTSLSEKPDQPQIIIEKPIDGKLFVNSIVLSGNVDFTTRGEALVKVGDITVFEPDNDDDSSQFESRPTIPIPLVDTELKSGENIEIFAWNFADSREIKLVVEIKLSGKAGDTSSLTGGNNITITPSDVRRRNSLVETIFPQQNYSDETKVSIIDMEGYTKMILNIASASNILAINSYDWDESPDNAINNNLSTGTTTTIAYPESDFVIIDFGSITTRNLTIKRTVDPAPTIEEKIEISDDLVSWNTISTVNNPTGTLGTGSNSFRYVRVTYTVLAVGSGIVVVDEIYDGNALGGSVAISFEVLDDSSGKWIELIPASDIGSFGFGTEVSKQLGDVVNDKSSQKFNVILPSTPTNFRAKLVATGNINTGVSIIKVD